MAEFGLSGDQHGGGRTNEHKKERQITPSKRKGQNSPLKTSQNNRNENDKNRIDKNNKGVFPSLISSSSSSSSSPSFLVSFFIFVSSSFFLHVFLGVPCLIHFWYGLGVPNLTHMQKCCRVKNWSKTCPFKGQQLVQDFLCCFLFCFCKDLLLSERTMKLTKKQQKVNIDNF